MAMAGPERKPGPLAGGGYRRAFLRLVLTVFLIDAAAIAAYCIMVFALGWDTVLPFSLVIVVSVITGLYFQWEKKRLTNG